ncbi:glycosyltransferase [Iningainema tapete]|uniref:Glycosyltransferase n=1 Tax=Iningainema tapete BLCC-T55 TaxID=2748662 RepID=A0A8J7C8Y1_9CYAN|nr:glycosyltransferase [Iningainema tapete]MBD2777374.1 glycosyltransferase [Iningainema tapete BLCC-T55]
MLKVSDKSVGLERSQSSDRKIMLFDLVIDGHHAGYIYHLIRFWGEQELPGTLYVVVAPKFIQQHTDVVDLAAKYGNRVKLMPITVAEEAALVPQSNYLQRKIHYLQQWRLCRSYAQSLSATHCLIMFFDTFAIPIAVDGKFPCSFSTIYFRPTFHYHKFEKYKPSGKERLQEWLDQLLLSLILRRKQLQILFCLDPFALKDLERFNSAVKKVYLPDPVQTYNDSLISLEQLKEKLGIDDSRKVFLFFGSIFERKGINQLLDAVALLSPDVSQKLCLLLVGEIDPGIEPKIRARINHITQSLPVQIITHNQFIPEREIQTYFQVADVILAPYQKHIGMSGILVRAAAAQKPVLSSDYGLMGEIARRYQLGITLDSTIPAEIAQGLTQLLLESTEIGDRTKMKSFAQQNSAENFASVIFQHI